MNTSASAPTQAQLSGEAPAPFSPGLLQLEAELVPIKSIIPSDTHIQNLRRKRFDPEAMVELAMSIRKSGVLNPILVRRVPERRSDLGIKYELVAGERRWLAAFTAGLAHIPVVIRELDNGEVLEAQLVENLQREGLNPLEEAEGYSELKQLKNYTPEEIGDLIGKSRSYVYARLKLVDLCPEARTALEKGELDASKALLLARVRSSKLQVKALKPLTEKNWRGDMPSYREAFAMLREKFMIDMNEAPFALDDATTSSLVGKTTYALPGACTICPHYSGNDPELQRDLGSAHVCTDAPCFELKVKHFWARKRHDATEQGRTVLSADEAKSAIPDRHSYGGFNARYLDLDAACEQIEFSEPEPKDEDSPEWQAWDRRGDAWKPPTYRQLIGSTPESAVLAADSMGKLHELVPLKDARALLKDKGVKINVPSWMKEREAAADEPQSPEDRKAEAAKEGERAKAELEYRKRLFHEIHAKWKGPLKREDWILIAEDLLDNTYMHDVMEDLYDGRPDFQKMSETDIQRFVVLLPIADEADDAYGKPSDLLALAARLKIDAKKIRAEVVKELKPTSAPPAPEVPAPKKPAKKRATKK